MIDALLARISTRFVFVVGKGGVGKTTTAGAIALALADSSKSAHLISTDPAHSIGDLFEQPLDAGVVMPSVCNRSLSLEAFSARAYADGLFAELRAPLTELIERGTYLDETDAAGFLDLSVPGIDEVMSALRLVDLYDSPLMHVIVDTAPTGHTLRLLDASAIIESWVAAGHAMAEKAGVVAAYLFHTSVALDAEAKLERLGLRSRVFHDEVLRASRAVVVTRAGEVVAAETRRLVHDLEQRGVVVAATISVFGDSEADFAVDRIAQPTGCHGLRAWPHHLHELAQPPLRATHTHSHAHPHSHAVKKWIQSLDAKLIFMVGKGGVGKSTCAGALACALAHERRVCVISTDPAGSLSEVFAIPVSSAPAEVAPNVFARQIDAPAEFRRMREEYRVSVSRLFEHFGLESSLRLDRNVIEALWNFAPPGIDELIAMVEMLENADEFDTVVIDAAPTGHFLRLLELPQIALEWVHALLRLLLKYSAAPNLDVFARDLLRFAKRLRQLQLDLSTPSTTAVFVVTLNQLLVAAETARLSSALAHAGLPVAATILNRDGGQLDSATTRLIRAPEMNHEIVGPSELRAFVEQWQF